MAAQNTDQRYLFGLFKKRAPFYQAAIINALFLSYYVLYIFRGTTINPLLEVPFHIAIIVILFVIPGFVTAPLIRRSYHDLVHLGAYVSLLSTASVLCVKLFLNLLQIPISALALSAAILVYSNTCLVWQRIRRARIKQEESTRYSLGSHELPSEGRRSVWAGFLVVVLLCAFFVLMESVSLTLPAIPDTDKANFGTYSIMTKCIPGAGYYEETDSHVYSNYTPFLLYDFSHPPLVPLSNACAATLGGYLEYSEILHQEWTQLLYRRRELEDHDYAELAVDQGYLACNRAATNYHIVLVCALIYLFARKLTGRYAIALIAMFCVMGWVFHSLTVYAFVWLSIYKSVFLLYSLLMLYCYLYFQNDHKLSFVVALYGSLASQKAVYAIPAILAVDIFRHGWRVIKNPFLLGFATGTVAFIVYGLMIDAQVFISHYFVRHVYDKLAGVPNMGVAILNQWMSFVLDMMGLLPFVIMLCLSVIFAVRYYKSRTIVLFAYFLSSAVIGSKIRPYIPRFLTPVMFPMLLMSCCSLKYVVDVFAAREDRSPHLGHLPQCSDAK